MNIVGWTEPPLQTPHFAIYYNAMLLSVLDPQPKLLLTICQLLDHF